MGRLPRRAALAAVIVASAVGLLSHPIAHAQEAVEQAMLDHVDGFDLVDEQTVESGVFLRTFAGELGELRMSGFAVETPPGVERLFPMTSAIGTFESIREPALTLANWLVAPGDQPGDHGVSILNFASREHLFTYVLELDDPASLDGPAFVRQLAIEQVKAAGAPPTTAQPVAPLTDEEQHLRDMLPATPPAGYGLANEALPLSGFAQMEGAALTDTEIDDFLNSHASGYAAAWGGTGLTVAVGITRYPYEIFAASDLATYSGRTDAAIPAGTTAPPTGAVVFRLTDEPQVGVVFRRGDILVQVLTAYVSPVDEASAIRLSTDMATLLAAEVPPGDDSPYALPAAPSRIAGLGLTAGFVIAAAAGAMVVARIRARRVRRRWSSDPTPAVWPLERSGATAIALDADAAKLRRRGAVVVIVQLATITVGVVALAGDFAWTGVIVAVIALLTGLLFSKWWLRREHRLLGPTAPPRAFRRPRPAGAIVGVVAFAVLGFGTAYLLKGLRYLILKPTLAQLRWSNLLGIAPRTVGVVFVLGGLAAAVIGSMLWRLARALGRAHVHEVLMSDRRPPVLYLRSFGDDAVALPIIASARRPLFELFSLRGADPFEECVAWELDSYGPVVAVGRPGGSLASLGAAREHLAGDSWHDQIAARMGDAGSIAVAPGETAGLAWELQAIVAGGHLGKTIFVFPPLAPTQLVERWEHTSQILRDAGASVGELPAPHGAVHTIQVGPGNDVRATWASTRDEATYRTAVDRALEIRRSVAGHALPPPALIDQAASA